MFLFTSLTYADNSGVYVGLPDGQKISLEGLTDDEKKYMIRYLNKIVEANKPAVVEKIVAPEISKIIDKDPEELSKWSKLIVSTIKDTCSSLNVTVNEFVTTPVGIGVSGLIIYKVIGKELLLGITRTIMALSIWLGLIIMLGLIYRYFLGSTLIYETIRNIPQEKGKDIVERANPVKIFRYPWVSKDARTVLGAILMTAFVLVCIVMLAIIF
jgi:hypothetical protein